MLTLFVCTLIFACSSSGDSATDPQPEPKTELPPGKPSPTAPANSEACTDFEEVPEDQGQAKIFFSWSDTRDAESYILQIFASGTPVSSSEVTTAGADAILDKGKTYSWTVTAKNAVGETTSDTFSFTTPSESPGNYVPYAADIQLDYDPTTGELSISWTGNDEDGDSLTYDLVVREGENILLEEKAIHNTSIGAILVTQGVMYSVEVISTDAYGNYSVSVAQITIE
jgi:hypothetical protein